MAQLVRVLAATLTDVSLIPGMHCRIKEPIPTQEPCSQRGEKGCGLLPLWLDVLPALQVLFCLQWLSSKNRPPGSLSRSDIGFQYECYISIEEELEPGYQDVSSPPNHLG